MRERSPQPERASVIRVFLLAFVVYAYFMPRWADWNIDSRFDLVRAIVDDHTLRIDRYHYNTWDKAVYPPHHPHYYSDKAPGTAVLGAGVFAAYVAARRTPLLGQALLDLRANAAWKVAVRLGRTATQGAPAPRGTNLGGCERAGAGGNVQYIPWGNRLYPPFTDWALSKYVTTVGVVALASAAFLAFLFWFLGLFTRSKHIRWTLVLLYGFATVALPYSTVLYSHQIAAACLFTAFALVYLCRRRKGGIGYAALAGFLLGFSLFTEYTVALVIAIVGLYGVWSVHRNVAAVAAFVGAGCVPVVALLVYNGLTFGSPFDTGYSHDYCWSAAQAAGIAGFSYPRLGPLIDLTVGPYRGLFFTSPFLVLAIPGVGIMVRRGLRLEGFVCLTTAVAFIVAISAYWGWNGGQVDGPRYLVPIVPFLVLPIVLVLETRKDSRLAVWGFAVAGLWSAFAAWAAFLGGELFPHSWTRQPLFDYSIPKLAANEIAPNAGLFFGLSGWHSLLPLCVMVLAIALLGAPLRQHAQDPSLSSLPRDRAEA